VRLWVEDNGIGIMPQDQERIFQMFVQVNGSQLYGGTGIGLALVKKAVQTMRGGVGVVSEEGKGSKFWVELNKASG
jgi:signal transduction histidine kinase